MHGSIPVKEKESHRSKIDCELIITVNSMHASLCIIIYELVKVNT